MRAVLIAGLVTVAGCSDGDGAYVHVATDDALIDRLEIYMAPDECAPDANTPSCSDQLTWDTVSTPRMGKLFILDTAEAVTEFQRDAAGQLNFRLHTADGHERHVKRIVVIGFRGTDPTPAAAARLKSVTIPARGAGVEWNIKLEPITDIPPGDPAIEHGTRIHLWSRDGQPAKCLVYQDWFDNVSFQEFLVSPTDSDCDALLDVDATECQPFRFNLAAPMLGKRCAAMGPLDPLACTVGSSTCTSDRGPACSQLLPQKCLPDKFCSSGCEKLDSSCFSSLFGTVPYGFPHFVCTFPNDQSGRKCAGNTSGDVALPSSGALCSNVGYSDEPRLEQPLVQSFMAGTASMAVTHDGSNSGCTAQVTWTDNPRSVAKHHGLIGFELANNGNTIYLPLIVQFEGNGGSVCLINSEPVCVFYDGIFSGDGVLDCLQ